MVTVTGPAVRLKCWTGKDDRLRQCRLPSEAARRVSLGLIGVCASRVLWGILMLGLSQKLLLMLLADVGDVLRTVLLVQNIHRLSLMGLMQKGSGISHEVFRVLHWAVTCLVASRRDREVVKFELHQGMVVCRYLRCRVRICHGI